MNQTRRVAPRVPYDEAIAIARFDGRGRLYARAIDLSATGIHVICSESCPIGTVVRCTLLLPGGPRTVRGRVVRETVLARGVGLAISFSNVDPGTAAVINTFIESRAHQMMPAKLRVAGVDRTLRCEGRVDDGTVRLTATLPFLRIDGGVDIVLGEHGELTEHGVIRKIAVDPSTSDGVPRLAVDVVLASDTQPYGAKRRGRPSRTRRRRPPSCPRPSGIRCRPCWCHPGWCATCARPRSGRRVAVCTAPPRSRAAPDLGLGAGRPRRSWSAARACRHGAGAAAQRLTARIGALGAGLRGLRAWMKRSSFGVLLMLVPAVLVVAALLAI